MARKTRHTNSYEYPRPALTVDLVVISREQHPRVLLIRRKSEPFKRCWAFPGGFVNEGEKLVDAARRELHEETGIEVGSLEQLYTAGDPGRDPRGWTVTVAYLIRINGELPEVKAADDAVEAAWHPLATPPLLAFDHGMILERAKARITDRMA